MVFRWYDFDPGKWAIKFLSFFNLTTDIRKVEEYKIYARGSMV